MTPAEESELQQIEQRAADQRRAADEAAVARIQLLRSYARDEQPFDFHDPKLLAQLLFAIQERLPDDLGMGGWESPTTDDHNEATYEILDLVGIAYRAAQIHGHAPA